MNPFSQPSSDTVQQVSRADIRQIAIMESSSHPSNGPVQQASRADIRRAVYNIVRRILLERLAQQRAESNDAATGLTKTQRLHTRERCRLYENILYKRSSSLEEYQDLSTLEERVFEACRSFHNYSRRQGWEAPSNTQV